MEEIMKKKQELTDKKEIILLGKIKTSAKKTEFLEILEDGKIKIGVKSPALEGKANKELILFLGDFFEVPKSNIKIIKGKSSKEKVIKIVK